MSSERSDFRTPISIIDEEPELETDVEFNEMINKDCPTRMITKFSKGYTTRTIITMACSSIECLTLILPKSCLLCGIGFASTAYFVSFIFSLYSLIILKKVILRNNQSSYKELVYKRLGKKMGNFFDVFELTYNFMCFGLYHFIHYRIISNLILGLNFHFHFKEEIVFSTVPRLIIVSSQSLVYLLLSNFKKLIKYSLFNLIIACSLIIFFFTMTFEFIFKREKADITITFFINNYPNYPYSYGLFVALFGTHYNLFESLSRFMLRTSKRSSFVLMWSQIIQSLSFFIFMIMGFLISLVDTDYKMLNMGGSGIFSLFLKVIIIFSLFFSVTVKLNKLIKTFYSLGSDKTVEDENIPFHIQLMIALAFLLLNEVIINFIRSPIFYISFIGGICSVFLFYYYPLKLYSVCFEERNSLYYIGHLAMIPNFCLSFFVSIYCIFDIRNRIPEY